MFCCGICVDPGDPGAKYVDLGVEAGTGIVIDAYVTSPLAMWLQMLKLLWKQMTYIQCFYEENPKLCDNQLNLLPETILQ